jgi:hypothetical protein
MREYKDDVKEFLNFFTDDELNLILDKASVVDESDIVINTKNYMFVLMLRDDKLFIEIDDKESNSNVIDLIEKDDFIKLLRKEEFKSMGVIELDA